MPGRRIAAAALVAVAASLLVWFTRQAAPPQLVQLTGPTMGSTYAISYHGKGAPDAAQMQREVQAILDEVDAAVSTYRSDSALARFNAAPAGTCMDMPQAATDLAQHAITLSQEIGGAFDTTLLPALQAWGFHRKTPSLPAPAPDEAQLAALRQRTGMAHLRVQGQQLCK
ncbi:MAG: FAD:protein FMN transferase, partial [Ottowia sp.]|nr:FAD:protein FMN transferase [Ottowia sp.]